MVTLFASEHHEMFHEEALEINSQLHPLDSIKTNFENHSICHHHIWVLDPKSVPAESRLR